MTELFKTILYTPLFNALIFISNFMPNHDLGLAIVVLTVLIRLIFLPLSIKSQRSQKALSVVQPYVEEIKLKYKNDKAAQGAAIMELYKKHNINPIAGCIPILIQLPILIALYQAFMAGLNPQSLSMLYPFVENPGVINSSFLGLISIANKKNIIFALLAGGLQFMQARQSMNYMKASGGTVNPQLASLNKQMLYFFPIMIVVLGWNLPAGLLLYWVTTTLFSIGEQYYLKRNN